MDYYSNLKLAMIFFAGGICVVLASIFKASAGQVKSEVARAMASGVSYLFFSGALFCAYLAGVLSKS